MKETFGEYIHKLRSDSGLTLTKLAAALDIDQSTLSKIENGKRNVPVDVLPKLSTVFQLDYIEFNIEFRLSICFQFVFNLNSIERN